MKANTGHSFAFFVASRTMYSGDGEAEAEGEEGKDDDKEEEDEGSRTRISGTGSYTTRLTRLDTCDVRALCSKLSARICRKLRFNTATAYSRGNVEKVDKLSMSLDDLIEPDPRSVLAWQHDSGDGRS